MNQRSRIRRAVFFLASAALVLFLANTAQARSQAWYVGAGPASGSVTSELAANQVYYENIVTGPFVYGVDLKDGNGFVFNVGYAFNKWIAIEALHTSLNLDASSNQYPGETLDANLTGITFGVRPMLPLGPLELFGRFGIGGYTLEVQRNVVVTGSSGRQDSTFSGGGYAFGGGVALSLGRLGIEAGLTQHKFAFDTLDGGDKVGTISKLDTTVNVASVILTIHFGRALK